MKTKYDGCEEEQNETYIIMVMMMMMMMMKMNLAVHSSSQVACYATFQE